LEAPNGFEPLIEVLQPYTRTFRGSGSGLFREFPKHFAGLTSRWLSVFVVFDPCLFLILTPA